VPVVGAAGAEVETGADIGSDPMCGYRLATVPS
jgi:hypothetical protein